MHYIRVKEWTMVKIIIAQPKSCTKLNIINNIFTIGRTNIISIRLNGPSTAIEPATKAIKSPQ